MNRRTDCKRICICMICMLLLLITFSVSANDQGSILLKAAAEDDSVVCKLSNTEFTMYQVGTYKNNSWVLKTEFAKSGVIFDFEDSSAQAAAAKKLEKYVKDNRIQGKSETTNSNGEILYKDLEKGVYLFIQTHCTHLGNQIYQSEPFIITVPGEYDSQVIWDVTAEPKFKNESIPAIITKTPPVSEEPDKGDTPVNHSGDSSSSHTKKVKTGDDTDIIIWLSLLGISIVVFCGWKRKVNN